MKIRLAAMIFYGTLKFLLMVILPLFIISLLEVYFPIMLFNDAFILGIIVLGVIGTILSILTHTFKKDTVAHGYTKIIDSIYSAIFTFYVFGGFTLGDGFGNYAISTSLMGYTVSARIGIQVIAYVLMISAAISIFKQIFKTAELKKNKEYHLTIKRKLRVSKVLSYVGVVTSLLLTAFIVSIPASAFFIRANLESDDLDFAYDWNGTLNDTSDDTLSMYLMFSIHNGGAWSIRDVRLDIDILVQNCINGTGHTLIDDGTRIGGSPDIEYNFYQFTSTTSDNISMSIETAYLIKLLPCDADLLFQLSFQARYAQLTLDVDLTFTQPWENQTA